MPQKKKEKKTNKKTHRKKHLTQKQNIIFQSIPNYSSGQFTGHQNNKNNIQYAPVMQQESRTDNLVGDLVSKLIGKIETDGNKQTQQYTQEIQPVSNTNTNSGSNDNTNSGNTSGNTQTVNVYPSSGQPTTTTDTPDPKKTAIETAAGTALSAATGYSAAETGGIAGGVAAGVGLIGGLIAGRKKLGQAIKNTFGGKKSGGTATSSRLLKEEANYVRGTKPGAITDLQTGGKIKGSKADNYAKLENELNPLHEDFHVMTMEETRAKLDKIREQAKQSEQKRQLSTQSIQTTPKPSPRVISTQTTPKPSPRATPTPSPRRSTTSPQVPQLNLRLDVSPGYIEPVAGVFRARMSGIQEHSGVLTRGLRREVGEPHTELKSKIPKSKNPEYIAGYDARRRDIRNESEKQLVPVYNLENKYNQGYFRRELKNHKEMLKKKTEFSSRSKNPFSGSEGSASEMSASEQSYTRPSTRQAQRMRSTMLSQTLTPESNTYVAKSGNKSN
jgi:hypothetical protein